MTEPENLILEMLRDIRGKQDRMEARLAAKIDALSERIDTIEIKLDGVKQRVGRLEAEKA